MKVKIKGLVFVGFAAAVFASSAMATIAEPSTEDKKVVTSKYYVDSTFQEEEDKVPATPTGNDADTIWASPVKYPSMAVLKAVKDSLDAVDVVDDQAGYVKVVEGTGANAGTYIVGLDKTPVTSNAGITSYGANEGNKLVTAMGVQSLIDTAAISSSSDATHLPTSQAVYTYAQDKSDRVASINNDSTDTTNYNGNSSTKYTSVAAVTDYAEATANKLAYNNGETITANKTSDVKFPTARNVYEFVTDAIGTAGEEYQPKVGTASTSNAVQIGYKADANSDATWGTLSGTGYVTISGSSGVYTANIDSGSIASTSTEITTGNSDLATAGAVYDFVSGAYQVQNNQNKLMVGYGNSWREIKALNDTSVAGSTTSYVTLTPNDTNNPTSYTINIAGQAVTTAGTAIADYDATTNNGDGTDLTTVKAVNEYVQGLLNGNVIPAADSDCQAGENGITSSNGKACALVMAYDSTLNSNAGGIGLKWIPMAQ